MNKMRTLLLALTITASLSDFATAINIAGINRNVIAQTNSGSQTAFNGSVGVFDEIRNTQSASASQDSNIIEMANMLQVFGSGGAEAIDDSTFFFNRAQSRLVVVFQAPNGGMFDLSGTTLDAVDDGEVRITLSDEISGARFFEFDTPGFHSTSGVLPSGIFRLEVVGRANPQFANATPDFEVALWDLGEGFKVTGNPPTADVPEPASATLLALAGLATLRRRRA